MTALAIRGFLVLGAMVAAGAPLLPAQQAPPGCTAAEHRQFDFWVGDWVVTDSTGTRILGANLITIEENGCLIHEHWKGGPPGGPGGTGQSFNYYDRVSRRWEQVWVASGGGVLNLVGALVGSSMRLEGSSPTPAGGTVLNRIEWIPQPDGRVRQLWTSSSDSGRTWTRGFDGWYRKRSP